MLFHCEHSETLHSQRLIHLHRDKTRHRLIIQSNTESSSKNLIAAMTGAWVRPKSPKKREPPPPQDPVETFAPLLQYFSGRRPSSPPKRQPKPITPDISRDPILQNFHKAQHHHDERPISSHSQKKSHQTQRTHRPPSRDHDDFEDPTEDHHVVDRRALRSISAYEREPSPPPPPVYHRPATVRPKPRVASYERLVPKVVSRERDRYVPRHVMPVLNRSIGEPPRVISSRWVSAATPLDIR